jgi:hypothetical protein
VIPLAVHDSLATTSCEEPQQSTFDTQSRESSIFIPLEYEIFYGADHTLEWSPPTGSKELAFALSYHFPLGDLESKMQAVTRRFIKAQKVNASGNARNLYTGDGNKPVEQETVADAPEFILPQDEPCSTSVTLSIIEKDDLSTNSSKVAQPDHYRREITPKIQFGSEKSSSHQPSDSTDSKENPPAISQSLEILLWSPEDQVVRKQRRKRCYEKKEAAQVTRNRVYACDDHCRRRMKVSNGLLYYPTNNTLRDVV